MMKTQYDRHVRRLEDLKKWRNEWESLWQDLADFVAPDRLRLREQEKRGQRNQGRIIDSVASNALRILKSGMHSGVTSPSRPWFKLSPLDDDLREYGPVKIYTDSVAKRMRQVLSTSNVYDVFHTNYGDLGLFGQSCAIMTTHPTDYIYMYPQVHGEFWLANNEWGLATTCYRRCDMSVEQIIGRFKGKGGSIPSWIQNQYDKGQYDDLYTVYNAIEPRYGRDPTSAHKSQKPTTSNYWVDGQVGEGKMLEESGFDHNPIIAPRWEPVGNDPYSPSPGKDTLPDVLMLQTEQTRKGEAIDKKVRPPMKGPSSMKNNPRSIMPGSMTYVDDPTGPGYTPAFAVNFDIRELKEDIQEVRERIKEGYYANLFLMLQNMEGVQPRNVMELTQRKEEQLLQLGPVLERVYREQLRPSLAIAFASMNEARILPPMPKELQGGMNMEFTGTLAQAQKAVATGSIERLYGFAGNLAAVKPDIMDKLDVDQTIDEYADMVGAPGSIVVADDKVKEIRDGRAKQQQAMMAAETAPGLAGAAKDGAQAAQVLAGTDSGGGVNASQLLSQLGIAG